MSEGGVRILGVDPGLASTGYGIVELARGSCRYLAHGCIETASSIPIDERLAAIRDRIREVIAEFSPVEGAMEELFFFKNVTSAIPVAEAKGVIRLACRDEGIRLADYTPLQIKMAIVGAGRGEKAQVQEMVRLILGLKDIPRPDHAADALAAAICHANTARFPA
jgi:crossover junction endodeoxyribonuclease RuvC